MINSFFKGFSAVLPQVDIRQKKFLLFFYLLGYEGFIEEVYVIKNTINSRRCYTALYENKDQN